MLKALIMIGTRPELVKVAPLILEMKKRGLRKHLMIVHSGQHKELMTNTFHFFGIQPDHVLDIMSPGQDLNNLVSKALQQLQELRRMLAERGTEIGIMLAQGDTATAFAAAITAFHNRIPFAHIEAGLRSHDLDNPFPEEYYRKVISICATTHFVPTRTAEKNLIAEGVPASQIILTGNTVVDCLLRLKRQRSFKERPVLFNTAAKDLRTLQNLVLITCHRRENSGDNLRNILSAVTTLAHKYPGHSFAWLLHPNPAVKEKVIASDIGKLENVHITEPLDYFDLISLYSSVSMIITDSGGIQEEAPSFGIPVIVLRSCTERTESISAGCAFLCGADPVKICGTFDRIVAAPPHITENPYGDGKASVRISDWLEQFLWSDKPLTAPEIIDYEKKTEL